MRSVPPSAQPRHEFSRSAWQWTLVAALLVATAAPAQQRPQADASLRTLDQALVRLSERISPSVVQINTDAYAPSTRSPQDSLTLRQSTGSGVIIGADGYIVTNAHVVAGATKVQVVLPIRTPANLKSIIKPRGKAAPARIVGVDKETDIAVVKVEATGLPFLQFADSDQIRQGQIVLALGSPFGLDNSVSMGVVSATARQLQPDDLMIYLQTDASINPGNSGGPMVDIDGNLIGINTMIFTQSGGSEGIGFAAPGNIVRHVANELMRSGTVRRGEIGIEAQTITPGLSTRLDLKRDTGVLVADVVPKGPADIAGIEIGDVVLSLNGKPMENARQLEVNLYSQLVNNFVNLEVLRGNETVDKRVVVVERQGDPERFSKLVDRQEALIPRLGILALAIDSKIAGMIPGLRRSYGILVAGLVAGTRPSAVALNPGDVIYSIDKQTVSTLKELRDAMQHRESGVTIVLQLERMGRLRFVEVLVE